MWLEQKKLRREQKHGEEHTAGIIMQVHANSGSDNQIRKVKDPPNPEGVAGASVAYLNSEHSFELCAVVGCHVRIHLAYSFWGSGERELIEYLLNALKLDVF
jgi:hypothetical protein